MTAKVLNIEAAVFFFAAENDPVARLNNGCLTTSRAMGIALQEESGDGGVAQTMQYLTSRYLYVPSPSYADRARI